MVKFVKLQINFFFVQQFAFSRAVSVYQLRSFVSKDSSLMGRKRVRVDSKFQPKKCTKTGDNDRISKLPDEILLGILSLLSLTEAARTSILSPRWKNLWKHTSRLDFGADSPLTKIVTSHTCSKEEWHRLRNREMRKYVKWVNSVLQSHKAITLEEFRICFDLCRSQRKAINQWLEFAFARHVQRLELDLTQKAFIGGSSVDGNYVFPEEFLTSSIGRDSICTPFDFKSLKALTLKYVIVTSEAIEFFLRNCPLLEQLVLDGTDGISNLEICGPSLALKHLDIGCIYDLQSTKVSAPNLTSLFVLKLEGLLVENVPKLVETSLSFVQDEDFKNFLPALSCCIFQLEILTLQLNYIEDVLKFPKFPELPKLKRLVVEHSERRVESLMGLTPLIRASPNLQEFVLRLVWYGGEISRSHREVKNIIKFSPHHHLKVFEFCGYVGRTSDVELVMYVLENCVELEKIVIDPRFHSFSCFVRFACPPPDSDTLNMEQTARDYAIQQLHGKVPQHIELVIL